MVIFSVVFLTVVFCCFTGLAATLILLVEGLACCLKFPLPTGISLESSVPEMNVLTIRTT